MPRRGGPDDEGFPPRGPRSASGVSCPVRARARHSSTNHLLPKAKQRGLHVGQRAEP